MLPASPVSPSSSHSSRSSRRPVCETPTRPLSVHCNRCRPEILLPTMTALEYASRRCPLWLIVALRLILANYSSLTMSFHCLDCPSHTPRATTSNRHVGRPTLRQDSPSSSSPRIGGTSRPQAPSLRGPASQDSNPERSAPGGHSSHTCWRGSRPQDARVATDASPAATHTQARFPTADREKHNTAHTARAAGGCGAVLRISGDLWWTNSDRTSGARLPSRLK